MPVVTTLSLEEITDDRINAIAKGTRRTRSAVVDLAVELLSHQPEFSSIINPQPTPRKRDTGKLKNTSKQTVGAAS